MSLYPSASSSKNHPPRQGKTEFELLKDSHKFLRDGDDDDTTLPWEDKLASKYYSSLYREFAVCDLKHYKSGNFALRWRTEDEVLSGAGETTCGNSRCKHHNSLSEPDRSGGKSKKPSLTTLELPFAYLEHGESKSALVKVVLCDKCFNKLMWKRRQAKGLSEGEPLSKPEQVPVKQEEMEVDSLDRQNHESRSITRDSGTRTRGQRVDRWDRERDIDREKPNSRRKSRSRSPRSHERRHRSRRRSP